MLNPNDRIRYYCTSNSVRKSPDSAWPLVRADGRTWAERKEART